MKENGHLLASFSASPIVLKAPCLAGDRTAHMLAVLLWAQLAAALDSPWNPYPIRGGRAALHAITAYGAIGDNATMNTAAIGRAFDGCARGGGGYVVVPAPGVFLTGAVRLRSGCYLLLEPGAALQASTNGSAYGANPDFWSLVVGVSVANSGVVGGAAVGAAAPLSGSAPGTAGGALVGTMWHSVGGYDAATNSFIKAPGAGSRIGNVFFQDSENVTVAGVRIADSGFWAQTFRRCRHVHEERVRVEGSVQWGTADGADVESGYNLTFRDSVFKTGDDCLAFRSGAYEQLRTPWPAGPVAPVQRVRLTNLTLTSSSCAVKLEASTVSNRTDVGDIFDVVMDGVRIVDSNRGIGIWQRSGERNNSRADGRGAIRDVVVRNVVSETRFDSKPQFWGSGEALVITVAPRNGNCCVGVENITVVNMSAMAENSALISSLSSPVGGSAEPPPIRGVRLLNVTVTIAKFGNTSRPQRDYRPVSSDSLLPGMAGGTVPALVNGFVVENVEDMVVSGGGVAFASSTPTPACWGMECINASSSHVHVDGRWRCRNTSAGNGDD